MFWSSRNSKPAQSRSNNADIPPDEAIVKKNEEEIMQRLKEGVLKNGDYGYQSVESQAYTNLEKTRHKGSLPHTAEEILQGSIRKVAVNIAKTETQTASLSLEQIHEAVVVELFTKMKELENEGKVTPNEFDKRTEWVRKTLRPTGTENDFLKKLQEDVVRKTGSSSLLVPLIGEDAWHAVHKGIKSFVTDISKRNQSLPSAAGNTNWDELVKSAPSPEALYNMLTPHVELAMKELSARHARSGSSRY